MGIPAQRYDQKRNHRPRPIKYPERDGKPMGETDRHVQCILDALQSLQWYFADRDDVYIAGNNFIYYEEGNPRARVSPDTYVVLGIPSGLRDTYFTWKNGGRYPNVVIEFTSNETRREDHGSKREVYEKRFGVPEYFLFDPRAEYQKPRLMGFRLQEGTYQAIELREGRLLSEQLGLELVESGDRLRFYDPARGRMLPTTIEESRRGEQEARRAEHEARARKDAEAEVERLRAEIEALKRERQK